MKTVFYHLLLGHVTADAIVQDLVIATGGDPVPGPHATVAEGQGLRTTDEGGPDPVPVLHVVTETTDNAHVPDLALRTKGGETEEGRERGRGRRRRTEIETVAGIDTDLQGRGLCQAAPNDHLQENRGEVLENVTLCSFSPA